MREGEQAANKEEKPMAVSTILARLEVIRGRRAGHGHHIHGGCGGPARLLLQRLQPLQRNGLDGHDLWLAQNLGQVAFLRVDEPRLGKHLLNDGLEGGGRRGKGADEGRERHANDSLTHVHP